MLEVIWPPELVQPNNSAGRRAKLHVHLQQSMSHDLAPHLLPAFFLVRKLYFGLSESRFRPKPTSRSFINLTKAE